MNFSFFSHFRHSSSFRFLFRCCCFVRSAFNTMCHVSSTLISAYTCDLVSFLSATYSICMELMSNFLVVLVCFVFVFYMQKTRDSYTYMFVFTLILCFLSVLKLLFLPFYMQKTGYPYMHVCLNFLRFCCLFCFVLFSVCFIYGHQTWGIYTCTCALTFFFFLCVQKTKGTYLSLSKADTSCHCVTSAADMFAHKEERG